MLAEFALAVALASPTPAPSYNTQARAAMTAAMQQTIDGERRMHKRQQAAVWSVAISMALDTTDCLQTSTRISHFGTVENDPLTPKIIKTEFYKDHPTGCILGWAAVNGLWYALTHRMDSAVQVPFPVGQAINLLSQTHDR